MLEPDTRFKLRRVIAVMNRKGGVGKTSIATNLAGVLAQANYRVLLIDLDQQGNAGDDLGYRDTDFNDDGRALYEAISGDSDLVPIKGVREKLDVIPAGNMTSRLADVLMGLTMRGEDPSEIFALKLAGIADKYDVIILDCPPGEASLQSQALVAARWILIPTQPDDGSLQGLSQLAERVIKTRPKNPTIKPLGVVLFPMVSSAHRVQSAVREKLAQIMGDAAPVFTSTIRFAQAAGVDARNRGQLAIELAKDAEGQDRFAWTKRLRDQQQGIPHTEEVKSKLVAESAGSLAGDYMALTGEILTVLRAQEEQEKLASTTTGVAS